MPEAARNIEHQEYWRPAVDLSHSHEFSTESCQGCGTDYAIGARFCHVCGREREPQAGTARRSWSVARVLDLEEIKSGLGLPLGSVVAFFLGLVCVIAAALTRFVAGPITTTLDWQAVEIWRVEWLLAAIAAFAVGILLKR